MSVDNRTMLNDCEATTGWAGDDTATVTTLAGQFFEGSSSLSTQLTNADEHMYTTQDSVGATTFSIDMSDMTIYMLIKNNLAALLSAGGIQFVIGDGTNRSGYDIGGNDAPGMPLGSYFFAQKLDVSVIVASPGTFTDYAGTEASMAQTTITQIGYGGILAIKAQGPVDNVFMDAFRYIANDSYALTVNGGTAGTPETMTDLVGDDIAAGWGMAANPFGSVYLFGAPTEWGNVSTIAEHAFTASNQQWFLYGDNGGGHAVGDNHFPFRLIGNSTDTGSFIITAVDIVSLGARADWLMDNADFNTIEIDQGSFVGCGTIALPSSGGTSRFTTNVLFSDCEQITNNGADMSGSSVLVSAVAANAGALLYNETVDPDGEMDDMIFSQGPAAHHAIEFGTDVPLTMTLRDIDFVGFSSSNDADGSVFKFLDTGGTSITLNLVGCTTDGTFSVDSRAGATITVVVDPVAATVNVKDNNAVNLQNARVLLEASDDTGPFPYMENITITRSGSTASVGQTAHNLENGDLAVIRGADQPEYNSAHVVSNVSANAYDYTVSGTPTTPATGNRLQTGQDETSYDGSPSEDGTFSGGTGHAVNDVLVLLKGILITVDAVSSGVVTQFTVDSRESQGGIVNDLLLSQVSSDGSGIDFSLSPLGANIGISASGGIIDELTDASGNATESRTFTGDQPVKGSARKSTASPRFKNFPLSGIIDNVTGLDINIMMTLDE